MKSNKGITIIILIVTIVIMLIITGTIVNQSMQNIRMQPLNQLFDDLELIEDKVALYYHQYGNLPIKSDTYSGSMNFQIEKNPNDDENYYIIDLSKLYNLTLNYTISNTGDDLYIINRATHTIYYPKGFELQGYTYYRLPSDYTKIE